MIKDLLIGEEGGWLTMDDGDVKDPLLDDNETAVARRKSCKNGNDPKGPCPCHPGSRHKWKECILFQEQQVIQ